MQINKSKKPTRRQSSNTLFDDDFATGFEDSKLEKFKPAIKVFMAIIVLTTAVWGGSAYFGSTDTKNSADKNYRPNTVVRQGDDSDSKLSQCITDAAAKNPTPNTTDPNFYPRLISGYDAQLACYDQYPDASGTTSRSSIEYARDNALDSSGDYKNIYISSSGSSSSSRKNSVTGCDYSLSESEYLACTDRYYAAHSLPSSSSPSNTGSTSAPPATPSTSSGSTIDVAWCSAKKREVSALYGTYQSARNAVQAKQTEINKLPETIRGEFSKSGTIMTEAQYQRAYQSRMAQLSQDVNNLNQQSGQALSTYNAAQNEYTRKPCY